MRYAYDLHHVEPEIQDVPVYDATQLQDGELIMLGATDPDSNADHGVAFITAQTGSSAEAVDALGIILDRRGETGYTTPGPHPAVTVTDLPDIADPPYLRAIINPFAVYRAEYDQADTMAVASTSTTTFTVTSLEDDIDIGWIFMVTATVSGNDANLRQLTASASGSATMDSALTGGNETSGTAIKILPVNHQTTDLATDSLGLGTNAAIGTGISLAVMENWMRSDSEPTTRLRAAKHRGLDFTNNARFFSDVILLDHIWNKGD